MLMNCHSLHLDGTWSYLRWLIHRIQCLSCLVRSLVDYILRYCYWCALLHRPQAGNSRLVPYGQWPIGLYRQRYGPGLHFGVERLLLFALFRATSHCRNYELHFARVLRYCVAGCYLVVRGRQEVIQRPETVVRDLGGVGRCSGEQHGARAKIQ
jgi:hypothetical protein